MVIQRDPTARKFCFVTIGATASFDALIKATLSTSFLDALQSSGYTDLLLQHGTGGSSILQNFYSSGASIMEKQSGITVKGFDFNKQGLGVEMRVAKGSNNEAEGVVISHAGMSLQPHVSRKSLMLTPDYKVLAQSLMLCASRSHLLWFRIHRF